MKEWLRWRAFHPVAFICMIMWCAALFVPAGASAADSAALANVEHATVNLYCRLRAGGKILSASGSGVVLSERGVILTNAHVAQYFLLPEKRGRATARCSVRTGSPAKARYDATVLYFPPRWVKENAAELGKDAPRGTGENDFALLSITDAKQDPLPKTFPALPTGITKNLRDGEIITIAGYPSEGLNFDQINHALVLTTASSTVTDMRSFGRENGVDILTLAPSAAGALGVSGGPVIDSEGETLGIATTKRAQKNDRTLRAITLSYIDRALRAETGLSLTSFLSEDPIALTERIGADIPKEIVNTITRGVLKRR